jgi:hypothetical protein
MRAARSIVWLLAASVFLGCGTLLGAQKKGAPGTTAPICPDGRAPAVDSETVTVTVNPGTAWNRRQYTEAERTLILNYADAIRQRFVPPPSLGAVPILAEWPQMAWGGEPTRHSAVSGKLVLVVKPNGRLREAFWQVLPFSAPLASAFYKAAIAADTAHDFEGMPMTEPRAMDDTLVVQVRTTESPTEGKDLPLMRVRLATYVPEAPTRVLKQGDFYYPMNAGDAGVANEGEMQVLVGSDGKAIMPASQITRIEWRDFISTMRRAVEGSVYQPATSNGCAVPSIIIQPFTFSIVKHD